jgi:hypothetical protein
VIAASGGTGALSYTINNGQTWQNSGSFPGLGAGNYQVKVKDQQNCEVIYMGNPVILTQPDSIIIGNVDVIGISCFGSSNGQIYIGASGGTGTLSYSIDNGQTWQSSGFFTGLLPGTYNIKVSDSQNCEAQYTGNPVILQDPPLLWFSSVVTSSISCYGLSDGTITISASGGTGLLRYSIDDGMTWYFNGGVFTGLPAGSYFIKVLDDNSCISIFQNNPVILLEPPEIMISSVQKTDVTAYGLADGTISIEASGGIPPLQYSVDNGLNWQPDSLFTGLAAGNYEIMVVDAIICKVNFPQNPVIINQPAVGMRDDNDALRLSVFPNPASGMVSFSATFSGLEPTSLIITNSLGLSVYHETDARKSFKNGRLVLNCSTWMPGLYHCLLSQHGQVAGAKLVVRSSGAERK